MYESYWQLQQKPFETGVDPQFYYPDESHQAALLKLRYAVESRREAALLAGASGAGKTLVLTMLKQLLGAGFAPLVHVVFPQMPAGELLAYLAGELTGVTTTGTPGAQESVRRIEQFLAVNVQDGRHAVVIIDEAHLLSDGATLESLRLLLNFQPAGRPALTLVLAGQPGLLPIVDRMPQLEERLAVKCLLRPLTVQETAAYVGHRLTVAGAKQPIFDPEAWPTLHELTRGIARRINRLCDLALVIGYAENQRIIGAAELESVAHELVSVTPE